MRKPAVFLNIPLEPPPLNRRIYAVAKMPFAVAAAILWWVAVPWLLASPVGMAGATVVSFLVNQGSVSQDSFLQIAQNTFYVGCVYTFYVGCVFFVLRLIGLLR